MAALQLRATPVVVPFTRRKLNFVEIHHVPHLGGNKHSSAEHEFFLISIQPLFLRKFQKQRPHYWNAGTGGFLSGGVNVRQHPIALLNGFLHWLLVLRPESPRLLILRPFCSVVAEYGIEGAQKHPPREKVCRRTAIESAYVNSNQRLSGDAHVEQGRHAHPQVVPGTGVISGPCRSKPLSAGIGSARQHKRALIPLQLQESFKSCAAILHSEHVVNRQV